MLNRARPPAFSLFCMLAVLTAARSQEAPALSGDEFEQLCKQLHIKSQPWAAIPWKVSVTEARQAAADARKPIFLVVNTGNCLGHV
jgi:hypothetical protein